MKTSPSDASHSNFICPDCHSSLARLNHVANADEILTDGSFKSLSFCTDAVLKNVNLNFLSGLMNLS